MFTKASATTRRILYCWTLIVLAGLVIAPVLRRARAADEKLTENDKDIVQNAQDMIAAGRHTFRFDTFGDEAFWGDTLKLHRAIEGNRFGGVGTGLSPKMALTLGLKVDAQALPSNVVEQIKHGDVNLDDPAVTLLLLKMNSVIGVTGTFNADGSLKSIGIQCAICHSTVDNSFQAPGIPPGNAGTRLDGWANRDLNVGAIIALAPDLSAVSNLLGLGTDPAAQATVRTVLRGWGTGKFDAELFLDGQTSRMDPNNSSLTTSAATLIPPAFGLAGVNLHTWTGWGSVTHWNAFVANLEMHGKGRFFDPRLNNAAQFPIAAKNGFGNVNPNLDPDDDLITSKLPALHYYQLSIPAPKSPTKSDSNLAAQRGDKLFSGKAKCNNCHVEPLWTEPGWNMHKGSDVCIDDFQANRAPDRQYRTSPLAGLWTHQKGGFFHDGRFATLKDVMDHYNTCFSLGLTPNEENDVIAYLLTL